MPQNVFDFNQLDADLDEVPCGAFDPCLDFVGALAYDSSDFRRQFMGIGRCDGKFLNPHPLRELIDIAPFSIA